MGCNYWTLRPGRRYQDQEQVTTPHPTRGMYFLVPALDICFWFSSLRIMKNDRGWFVFLTILVSPFLSDGGILTSWHREIFGNTNLFDLPFDFCLKYSLIEQLLVIWDAMMRMWRCFNGIAYEYHCSLPNFLSQTDISRTSTVFIEVWNYICIKLWGVISYPYPKFNSNLVKQQLNLEKELAMVITFTNNYNESLFIHDIIPITHDPTDCMPFLTRKAHIIKKNILMSKHTGVILHIELFAMSWYLQTS